jgi:hypothetical protein
MYRPSYDRAYYLKNRDKILARKREWYKDQRPDKRKAKGRRMHLRMYGLTPEGYAELLKSQSGKCALCGAIPDKILLHVDHCHNTGEVRGLLCFNCNAGIGHLKDNAELCYKASVYLTPKFPIVKAA